MNKDAYTSSYDLNIMDNILTFSTTSFKPEKSSVLPSGVYSKEFSSMLLSSGVCIVIYMIMGYSDSTFILYLLLTLCFVIFFYISRTYVFRDAILTAVFNNRTNMVVITRPVFMFSKTEKLPLSEIDTIEIGTRTYTPRNPDGIAFVEKISAQHGSYVPGLGDEEEFVTLTIKLKDGTERIIYAGPVQEEPDIPLNTIKTHMGMKGI